MSRITSLRSGVRSTRLASVLVLLTLTAMGTPTGVRAQLSEYQLEVGGMVGRLSGLSLKAAPPVPPSGSARSDGTLLDANSTAYTSFDAHLSFNTSGYVSVSGYVLRERAVPGSPLVAYLGPGLNIQVDDSAVFLGPSAEIGVFFALSRYRVFLQIVPQMHLVPELRGEVLAAAGLRLTL